MSKAQNEDNKDAHQDERPKLSDAYGENGEDVEARDVSVEEGHITLMMRMGHPLSRHVHQVVRWRVVGKSRNFLIFRNF